jgi:hypothetical protein
MNFKQMAEDGVDILQAFNLAHRLERRGLSTSKKKRTKGFEERRFERHRSSQHAPFQSPPSPLICSLS